MTFGDPLWSAEAVETLKDGAARGLSASKIAAEIKATHKITVTRNAVIGKLRRMDVKLKSKAYRPAQAPAPVSQARAQPSPPRPLNYGAPPRPREPELTPLPGSDGRPRTLLNLPRSACKWVLEGEGRFALFCARPAPDGPYCEAHAARAADRPQHTDAGETDTQSNSPRGGVIAPASPQRAGSGGHGSTSPAMAAAPPGGGIHLNRKTLAEVDLDAVTAMRSRNTARRKSQIICRKSFSTGPCADICRECAEFQMPQPRNGDRHAAR